MLFLNLNYRDGVMFMSRIYQRTFKRTVKNGNIRYAGQLYTADELASLNNQVVKVTKFSNEVGCFDISKLLVNPINSKANQLFWVS